MLGLPSKNTTWKVTAPPNEKWGVARNSTTSCRLGAWPSTSKRTESPAAGNRSSQNGAIRVGNALVGSGWLSKPKKLGELKLSTPLLTTNNVVLPGSAPPNRIGNGDSIEVEQKSQRSGSTVPVITGNS